MDGRRHLLRESRLDYPNKTMTLPHFLKPLLARTRTFRMIRYGEHPRPVRDWLVVMAIVAIFLMGSAGWSYGLFLQVSHGDAANSALPTTGVNTASLATVRAIFEARAAERARYISEYRFVDPSR
jgi:hypothetical protein